VWAGLKHEELIMRLSNSAFALFAGILITGTAVAQNSGSMNPDETDITKQQQQQQLQFPDSSIIAPPAMTGQGVPPATTGQGVPPATTGQGVPPATTGQGVPPATADQIGPSDQTIR